MKTKTRKMALQHHPIFHMVHMSSSKKQKQPNSDKKIHMRVVLLLKTKKLLRFVIMPNWQVTQAVSTLMHSFN